VSVDRPQLGGVSGIVGGSQGRGVADSPGNMQWQTKAEVGAKDRVE
jgi:hypothetical protein